MNLTLRPEHQQLIESQISSGRYTNSDEIIAEALELLIKRDRYNLWVEEVHHKVAAESLDSAEPTLRDGVDGDKNTISKNPPNLEQTLSILKKLKPYIHERWGVVEIAVFGSVARGESTIESDIDILFDYDQPIGLEIVSLSDFLEEKLKYKVDLLSKKAVRSQEWDVIGKEVYYA